MNSLLRTTLILIASALCFTGVSCEPDPFETSNSGSGGSGSGSGSGSGGAKGQKFTPRQGNCNIPGTMDQQTQSYVNAMAVAWTATQTHIARKDYDSARRWYNQYASTYNILVRWLQLGGTKFSCSPSRLGSV